MSPALRTDASGNLHATFGRSSSTFFPESRVVARSSTDAVNTLGGSILLKAGDVAYNGQRWGDYQAVAIDPSDPSTAWFASEYTRSNGPSTFNWGTWIGSASFSSPSVSGNLRVATSPAVPSQIRIDGIPRDRWGLTWMKLPPGTYRVSFSDVGGFSTPPPQSVLVTASPTTVITGTFPQAGFLRVVTSPAVPATTFGEVIPRNDWGR